MSDQKGGSSNKYEEEVELRRGPWTLEEDTLLIHYISCHGEGRWNLLARSSGLKRTGKSCRLRWLNYLKPDIKRGNLSPEEQLLILELHSKWGNRWSRIAQHLPGRTDNEIKNYWRTRVQKQAKQLKIDANSARFREVVRCFWMPRLMEKMGSSDQSLQTVASNTYANCLPVDSSSQVPFQEAFHPSILDYQFENSSTYELSRGGGGGGGNQSPCNSSVTTAALPSLVPNFSGFASSPPQEFNGVVFDPFDSRRYSIVDDACNINLGSMELNPVSATSEYTATAINNCTNSSSTAGDVLWSMDELHDMFDNYMKGTAESN